MSEVVAAVEGVGGKTVLVLDDSEILLDVVAAELAAAGFEVRKARDLEGFEGVRRATSRVDLVLLDVQMPEMFGDELGVVLKDVYGMSCPVMLLSSLEASELKRRVDRSGLDGYICKSDGMDHLVQRVKEILG